MNILFDDNTKVHDFKDLPPPCNNGLADSHAIGTSRLLGNKD